MLELQEPHVSTWGLAQAHRGLRKPTGACASQWLDSSRWGLMQMTDPMRADGAVRKQTMPRVSHQGLARSNQDLPKPRLTRANGLLPKPTGPRPSQWGLANPNRASPQPTGPCSSQRGPPHCLWGLAPANWALPQPKRPCASQWGLAPANGASPKPTEPCAIQQGFTPANGPHAS